MLDHKSGPGNWHKNMYVNSMSILDMRYVFQCPDGQKGGSMKVVIYSGVPGSGKSTLAATEHPGAPTCSADHFFERGGSYAFDPAQLPQAHAACLRKFVELLQAGNAPVVVVDNTNTTAFEIAPYAALALAYGAELEIVTVNVDPDVAAARNTHGVPVGAVRAMAARLAERALPPWWPQRAA